MESEPCLTTLKVTVRQSDTAGTDEALITITDSLLDQSSKSGKKNKGLPGYTYRRAPGKMWRSRFDIEKNVIVINNGHRDFVYAGKQKSRKLRYICRLFCKELVRHNFPGMQVDELLEERGKGNYTAIWPSPALWPKPNRKWMNLIGI